MAEMRVSFPRLTLLPYVLQLLSVIRTSNLARLLVCCHPGRLAVRGSAGFCTAAPVVVFVLLRNSN